MPFEIGHTKVGGRRKGVPNRSTQGIREFARGLLSDPEYQRRLKERILAGKAERIEALLYVYGYGKPEALVVQPNVPSQFTLDVAALSPQRDLEQAALPSADDDSP